MFPSLYLEIGSIGWMLFQKKPLQTPGHRVNHLPSIGTI